MALFMIFVLGTFCLHFPKQNHAYAFDSGHDIKPLCEAFAAKFADAAAQYTKCFVVNSRPMTLCTKCVDQYLDVNRAYENLEKVSGCLTDDMDYSTRTAD